MTVFTEEMDDDDFEDEIYPISPELMKKIHLYPEELSREELKVVFENFSELSATVSSNIIAECFLRILILLKPC